ncbi:MAG: hypothetical protein NXI31_16500 [bacterium]|nr:hypothetical protein [bacterium]
MKATLTLISTLICLTSAASAQRLVAYEPGRFREVQPDNPMLTGSVVVTGYPAVPALAPPPVAFVPPGDSTFASFAGLNLYTNGLVITSTPTDAYPPSAPPLPPLPIPAGLLTTLGGPVTGMAYDPLTGTVFLTAAAGRVVGVSPSAGMPITVPAFSIPFTTGAITGLEYDALTSALLAVDVTGTVYVFTAAGVPSGPPIVPTVAPPAGMTGDVAIDKTDMKNAVGARPIYVSSGGVYYDVTLPVPTFEPHGLSPRTTGLAFQPMPAQSLPLGGCPCGGMTPAVGVTSAAVAGNTGFGLTVSGVAPSRPVLFGLDFAFTAAFPVINGGGCGLGLIPGSPTLVTGIVFADAAGTATYPLALTVLPGFGPLYAQALMLCPADPAGFAVTPMQQVVAGGV